MKPHPILAVTAVLLTAACSSTTADAPAAAEKTAVPAATDYVALGDSYAAGLGGGGYAPGSCLVSTAGSYPALWAAGRTGDTVGEVVNNACSGARIADVAEKQLSALDKKTGWVTVTVGGNDAGFTTTLQQCLLGDEKTCTSSVKKAVTGLATMPDELGDLFTTIRDRAPNAKVYVLGYPHLVVGAETRCDALSATRREVLNAAADTLDEAIETQTGKHDGFTFVDVRKAFEGHEACADEPWINALADNVSESFHPDTKGYQAYADALAKVTG
ncbi:lipase 1 [Actinoplanes sp. NBRC 101535]|nr:lipase 1 [Actinoplanes sp. NBRC 101535]